MVNHSRNDAGNYGPTTNGNFYQSKEDHRRTAQPNRHKTRWIIEEGEEFHVFKIADEFPERWFCYENDCLFSLVDDCKTILGQTKERLAKFPRPGNQDPWHGYPIKLTGEEPLPSDDLLDLLYANQVISETTKRRIERRRI